MISSIDFLIKKLKGFAGTVVICTLAVVVGSAI